MIPPDMPVWPIILGLGIGSFLLRFSFIGLIGARSLPDWVLRHLRYTPVAILPGLVAPMIFTPGTQAAPLTLLVSAATLAVGAWTRNVLWAIAAGIVVYLAGVLLG